MELNADEGGVAGTTEPNDANKEPEPSADVKPVEEPSTPTKQESEHVPSWRRKIAKQTAQIKSLRSELESLKAQKSAIKLPSQEYTEDNFVSKEEYKAYKEKLEDQKLDDKLTSRAIAERQDYLRDLEHSTQTEKFQAEWSESVVDCYGEDPEGLKTFAQISTNKNFLSALPEVVHDFMEGTKVGPIMMHVLYLRPDLVDRISESKPVVQAKMLMALEQEITQVKSSTRQAQPAPAAPSAKPISRAPAPIGPVGTQGRSVTDDDETDEAVYERLLKKRQQSRGR